MRLILLGAPGVGKGTQAAVLSERFNIPHISTGDMFRSNISKGTELGKRAKEYIDKGALVPDEVTVGIVEDRLKEADCENGFVLDGFPRTIPQAEFLEKVLDSMKVSIDYVIEIQVSDSEIIKRMSGRRVCSNCGASYHTVYNVPKVENVCDVCQSNLIQRSDDKEETVKERLKTYHAQTEPLISYYKEKGKLVAVEGQDEIEDTIKEVLTAIGAK